ncbi:methylhydantoinase [Aliidongia dinghuensis]|uniref:Methylhydantoinase n=1 Tax=Aliidongia dinghuensis TaxID=1867774 RepID=A0A8J2Z059_9PROT|nr:hydantoinase/oxoprolinase family protein [Aliidongia dinghuensis]GGF49190.1 methylhydantoinase [Aliidongia dinghuensis]
MAYQIAVDVGGTFTDGVLLNDATDTIWVAKSLTTPADPGDGIARVVEMLLDQLPAGPTGAASTVDRVVHGTTLITNTLLERKGARTALVVTHGAEDVLDIRREMRYDTYDLAATFPEPLVPPEARFPVAERIGPAGEIRRPLSEAELGQLADRLAQEDVSAVAICFLHACVNDQHERAAAEVLRRVSPGRSYSLSSEVASEVGEYERMSTVVANAYVQPVVEHYMRVLSRRLAGLDIAGRLDIMVSHGGFTEAEIAARFPIRLLESGPAGGVLSAINCGQAEGIDRVLAFDMGGTTAKSCVSIGGTPAITHVFEFARVRRFKRGSGLPAVSPSIDLIEIGAGGGSIARRSALGLLQVGPDSSGSEPGPACYDLGGTQPTVTDADLVLGYLDADNFLGGTMKLSNSKALDALAALGAELGLTAEETAWGIHDIVNENMAAAARTHIAEHGHDARSFTFVSTGGAGPVHAVDVARRLRIPRVLCPIASGVGSCLGFLAAPARSDRSWSRLEPVHGFDQQDLDRRITAARGAIATDLARAQVAPDEILWRTAAEMRYLGQGASIEVDFAAAAGTDLSTERLLASFEAEYRRLYGRTVPDGVPEIVTWRIAGQSPRQQRHYAFATDASTELSREPAGQRRIYLPGEKRYATVPVFNRYRVPPGTVLAGPAIIVEPESTLVVGHPARISVLASGTIQVDLEYAA